MKQIRKTKKNVGKSRKTDKKSETLGKPKKY